VYCAASARFIFGDLLGEPVADSILRALRQVAPNGLTKTDIYNLFSRNLVVTNIDKALIRLLATGKTRREQQSSGGGRPREVWYSL
jgi:hypothetical protein